MLPKLPVAPLCEFGEFSVLGEDADGVVDPEGVDGVAGVAPDGGLPPGLPPWTLTANFMPCPQCKGVGHMKYIVPALDKVMVVLPPE